MFSTTCHLKVLERIIKKLYFCLESIHSFLVLYPRVLFLFNSGGWTLISRFLMKDPSSSQDAAVEFDSYREILPNYHINSQRLLRDGFNHWQLKSNMGLTQIRFYCYKKKRDGVFHIITNQNNRGGNVVKFFTESDTIPKACDSFTRLPDDNSTLSNSCSDWGFQTTD